MYFLLKFAADANTSSPQHNKIVPQMSPNVPSVVDKDHSYALKKNAGTLTNNINSLQNNGKSNYTTYTYVMILRLNPIPSFLGHIRPKCQRKLSDMSLQQK